MNTTTSPQPSQPGSSQLTFDDNLGPQERLDAWRSRGQELKARSAAPGIAKIEDIAHLRGLEIYEAMMRGELPPPPIFESADFMLVEVEPGRVVFQGEPLARHYNPLGTIHGGWISTLLDSALALSIQTVLPPGKVQTTAELKINFVRALTERVPLVRAEGRAIHVGGRMATSDARLYGADGKLYAHGSTTCFVYDWTEAMGKSKP